METSLAIDFLWRLANIGLKIFIFERYVNGIYFFIFFLGHLENNIWTLGEALHTSKMNIFGCAAIVTCELGHNVVLDGDIKDLSVRDCEASNSNKCV